LPVGDALQKSYTIFHLQKTIPMLPWLTPSSPVLSDVRDTPLSKLVRDEVLGLILGGTLSAGQRINEPDVAARLKVSRVPVREALRELESSGLVVSRKHAGVFVRQLDAAEIRDLYEMRSLLDGYAGRRVAQLPSTERQALVSALEDSIAVMNEAAAAHDVQRYYRENLRFHWAIVEAAGNAQLAETYRGVVQRLHLARLKNLSHDLGMRASIAEHVQIVLALRTAKGAADAALCEQRMARHVSDALTRLTDHPTTTGDKP
jgi:DNA-binding GntR family transcriptional regulator